MPTDNKKTSTVCASFFVVITNQNCGYSQTKLVCYLFILE